MADTAFGTLGAARRLKAAGIESEQAEAIVEVMGQSVNQLVTAERFESGIATLHARIDSLQVQIDAVRTELQARIDAVQTELLACIDAVRTELRAEISRSLLIAVGVMIAANALMMAILGIVLTAGGSL